MYRATERGPSWAISPLSRSSRVTDVRLCADARAPPDKEGSRQNHGQGQHHADGQAKWKITQTFVRHTDVFEGYAEQAVKHQEQPCNLPWAGETVSPMGRHAEDQEQDQSLQAGLIELAWMPRRRA